MQVRLCVLDADYILKNEQPVLRLWGVDEKGKSVVAVEPNFRPYFYILPDQKLRKADMENLMDKVRELKVEGRSPERVEEVEMKYLGKPASVLKVTVTRPPDVPKFRELVKEWVQVEEEFEYGVSFYRRYLIDRGITPMGWVEVEGQIVTGTGINAGLVVRIEELKVLEKGGVPPLKIMAFDLELAEEKGEEKIIMASLKDSSGFGSVLTYRSTGAKGVEVLKDERELLKRFMEIVEERDPDILCGYNTDRFDFLKLDERANKYRDITLSLGREKRPVVFKRRARVSSARLAGRVHVDLYDFVQNILSQSLTSEVLTLDMVSREILGIGKKSMKLKEIEAAWRQKGGIPKLARYCMWDSELALNLAYHLLPQMYQMCKVTGQTLFDASRMTYSQLVEWVLMRRAHERGEIVQNRPKFDEVQRRRKAEPYAGAYVHLPKEGIHDGIAVFDFRSLYPSIIVSHNISPETLDCGHRDCKENEVPEMKHCFCTKEKGFIPQILEEVIKRRIEVKEQMKRMAKTDQYKELYNRQFALKILANSFYGYYGYAGSRWYSRVCARSITSWGRYYIKTVIGMAEKAGMDVLYGDTDSLFLKISSRKKTDSFLKRVNRMLPGIMELEFKGMYKRGIFIEAKTGMAAKKKYALLSESGELVMRGMETRRRDWAKIAKETQERVLMAILKENSRDKAVEIVRETVKELKKGKVGMEELVIYTQLTKPISEYEQMGPHVKAAKKLLQRGRPAGEGSTIAYIITKGTGSISDRAEPAEDAGNYDPEYYIYHQVLPPALRILSGLGVTEEELAGEGKVRTLKTFFKK